MTLEGGIMTTWDWSVCIGFRRNGYCLFFSASLI